MGAIVAKFRSLPHAIPGEHVKRTREIEQLVRLHKEEAGHESDDEHPPPKPFVEWPAFNAGIGVLILVNALTMGMETDARVREQNTGEEISGLWYLLEIMFCLVYVGELVARLYFLKLSYFHDGLRLMVWNCCDAGIVLMSFIDTMILQTIGSGGSLRFVLLLRMIRIMRLVRLIRLLRIFKELWLITSGLLQSTRTLGWIALITYLFIYICSIFMTIWVGKNDDLYDPYYVTSGGWDHEIYFKTMGRSTFTLFQVLTMEGWSQNIARHVGQNQPWLQFFFVIFIGFGTFGILNVVIAVIVERTLATANLDEDHVRRSQERDRLKVLSHLRDIFEAADEDGSGTLTLKEVQKAIEKPEIYNKLKMIEFPVEDPKGIFDLLDFDDSGEVTIEEFITGCVRIKGTAKSKDLLAAQVAIDMMKFKFDEFEDEMATCQEKISKLEITTRALIEQGEHVFLDAREYRMRHPKWKQAGLPRFTTGLLKGSPWDTGDVHDDGDDFSEDDYTYTGDEGASGTFQSASARGSATRSVGFSDGQSPPPSHRSPPKQGWGNVPGQLNDDD
eukprot:gnl/TRDRNA2_/TRDRNA2_187610_c0_seq1.p1 gnl/TRDRNA2_/TRDRNA2_187610_c0~~gnl/TRDRNA2_/TRDRNA2_187610_c0_seq1.p1  ORF type:complete len:578 (-),score=125.73 gnl/TRDRNA2_/TRDRNA2_187610_c0_seq1:134-1810(-)